MRHVERARDGSVVAEWCDDEPCPVFDFSSRRIAKQRACAEIGHKLAPVDTGGHACQHCHLSVTW